MNITRTENRVQVITTNLCQKADGSAVMGAGLAKYAASILPDLPAAYGEYLRTCEGSFPVFFRFPFLLVPTKIHWKLKSPLRLVQSSILVIAFFADLRKDLVISVPKMGCRNGGLKESDVMPFLNWLSTSCENVEIPDSDCKDILIPRFFSIEEIKESQHA